MEMDTGNSRFQLALQFVEQTNQHVFLTGKAGTGKTSFLKYIRERGVKRMAIVAPTGVAAINAGGVTMHSFFQLPFGPFVPTHHRTQNLSQDISNIHSLFKHIRFNNAKRELLRELELLVIDEVSMLRADMLDAIDLVLRHFRKQPLLPFGGLQVLYIGDLFQLPPVVNQAEWDILQAYYKSPFFFDALALQQAQPVYLELTKIYRQNEARFIRLLNNIRNNRATESDLEILQERYHPGFRPTGEENYITLTTHNSRADTINQQELAKLKTKVFEFEGTVKGEFSEKAFPAEKTLYLKEGAQVMFLRNDKGEERRFFNGKIGYISRISREEIHVKFPAEPGELLLEKETWKNIRYQFSREKNRVEEEEIGEFTQYPVRLAWAITIHKSQGLTFSKAIIDAGASFAPGQVYVALSRLTNLEGMILFSRILPHSINTDERVLAFTQSEKEEDLLQESLQQEQRTFVAQLMIKGFSWTKLVEETREFVTGYEERLIPERAASVAWAGELLDEILRLETIGIKFGREMDQLLPQAVNDGYVMLLHRMEAAGQYFNKALDAVLLSLRKHINEVKFRPKTKKYVSELQDLNSAVEQKKQQIGHALTIAEGLTRGAEMAGLLASIQAQAGTAPVAETDNSPVKRGKEKKNRLSLQESRRLSLELFRQKKDIGETARARGLARSTIEGHLVSFIENGELDIREWMPEERISELSKIMDDIGANSVAEVREKTGETYSYGDLRAVIAYREHLRNKQ